MPSDANLALQPQVTKTATFTGPTLILASGTPRRGLNARVIYSAATNASGANAVTFALTVSKDGGVTFNTEFQTDPINLTTIAQGGELYMPFSISPNSVLNGTQVQLVANFAGAGATPTITYQGDVVPARP